MAVLPQVQVFQEFQTAPAALNNPLRALIAGGNAQLFRYSDPDEKLLINLGEYVTLQDTAYTYPNRPAGSVIDQDYIKVFVDEALLRYFTDDTGSGSTIAAVAGYRNRVRASAINFKTNGSYTRDSDLYDRDVAPGDVVFLQGGGEELWSYVRRIIPDQSTPTVGTPRHDAANVATQSYAAPTIAKIAGLDNCVGASADSSSYDGTADGDVNEVYTIEVSKASTGGALQTAEFLITSASGHDDQVGVSPDENGVLDVGRRGLQVTFLVGDASSCSLDAEAAGISPGDLLAGQTWRVTVQQAFEASTAQSSGTYTGTRDTAYIVEVTRGGSFAGADKPQITVTTTHGVDVSGPTNVTGPGVWVAAGTKGVNVRFYGTGDPGSSSSGEDNLGGLRKGDRFYIDVTAAADAQMRTLELAHNLPQELLDVSDLRIELFIKKNLELSRPQVGFPGQYNYEVTGSQVTISSTAIAYDESWTDGGVELPLDLLGGTLFLQYRAWLSTLVGVVNGLSADGDIDDIPGPLDPDNPLKYGVSKARGNSGSTEVKYIAVADPTDVDDWSATLEKLVGRTDVYNLAPMTTLDAVLEEWAGHVETQSGPSSNRWRTLWLHVSEAQTVAVVDATTTDDEEVALAIIEDDPDTDTTDYTLLTIPAANASFTTRGVRAGDKVRTFYSTDGFEETYQEFTIDEVVNEDTLKLSSGPESPVSEPQKMEVWRTLSATEYAEAIGDKAASYGSRRVRAVWPDTVEAGGTTVSGMFMAAALAGLASGVVPQQGLTNVEITGFEDVPRTTILFNATQLNAMASAGTWIVTETDEGQIITRHAVTTGDTDDINQREEMITRNLDAISFALYNYLAPFIGRTNVTPTAIAAMRVQVVSAFEDLKTNGTVDGLGPQIIDVTQITIARSATLRDKVVIRANLVLPYPLNLVDLHLIV